MAKAPRDTSLRRLNGGAENGNTMPILTKIISGGQTGADQGALDAAIELGIEHGGWIPKGRLTEDGPLPEKYHLTEMPTASYPKRTEKNVEDSDGTVIFTRGPLSGGSKLTAELAKKHGKPWLHIDLGKEHALQASTRLHEWIVKERIQVLNVAGANASKDPGIHNDVHQAIWGLFTLDVMGPQHGPDARAFRLEGLAQRVANRPETIEEAVELLEKHLPLEHRVNLARMDDAELVDIHLNSGAWIRETFGLWQGNDKLIKSIEAFAGRKIRSADEASAVIVEVLAKRLRRSHRLRVVK